MPSKPTRLVKEGQTRCGISSMDLGRESRRACYSNCASAGMLGIVLGDVIELFQGLLLMQSIKAD